MQQTLAEVKNDDLKQIENRRFILSAKIMDGSQEIKNSHFNANKTLFQRGEIEG